MFSLPKRIFRKALLALSVVTSCVLPATAQQTGTDKTILSIERNKVDNSPKSITFAAGTTWRADQANDVFTRYLNMRDNDLSMKLISTTTTPAKITTQRYAQYYKGLKVQYAGYTLTIKDDVVHFITGNYYDAAGKPSAVPTLTEGAALAKALQFVGAEKYKWQDSAEEAHIKKMYHKSDTSYFPKGQLVWIEDMLAEKEDRKLHLAYSFNIYAEQPLSRQEVFIDAKTGKVLFSNSLLKHTAATGKTLYSGVVPFRTAHVGANYLLFDSTRGSGVHTLSMHNTTNYATATEVTSATNIFPTLAADTTALDAHWGGEMVYDYWLTQQGRHSWDDLDGILLQYVHYSTNYNNAYWDGVEMTYGDGTGIAAGGFSSLTSIDVTAHEIGHGVCEATANLVYSRESGAMNEGFSDCWAATIENWANPHEIDAKPKAPWSIGEEISTEPLRSMNAPLLQGQPNTYGSTNWVNVVGCTPGGGNDQCGVHTNSGLLNYWYYLLVNGGSGVNGLTNAYIVNPLGWVKSSTVLYQTELLLASNATYADCRVASINAATVLYGACSPEVQCVTSAWYAVGVGANYVPCVAQLGFTATSVRVSEKATVTTCPASKTITIGMKAYGPLIAGGTPVVNVVAAPTSTAVAGVDYTISPSTITFGIGDLTTHNITVTIFDNGAVNDDKHIDLAFTIVPGGSGAEASPIYDSMTVFIDNDDSIPQLGGVQRHTLNAGVSTVCDFTSPFYGKNRRAHSQFLLLASEMQAAGVVPGAPISQIAFNVLTKSSTGPFTGFSVSMKNSTVANLATPTFVTAMTQVYSGNPVTNLGIDSLDFNVATFTWDGTSNVVVEFCYGMNAAAFAANDMVAGVQQDYIINGDYTVSNTGTGTGCTLTYSTGNQSTARPVVRFKQTVPPAPVETAIASNRVWDVHAGQEVYFYNPANSKIIAGLKNVTNDLGCVTATVSQQGTGFTPASFSAINRSLKEITITPTTGGATTAYDATIYLTNTELGAVAAGTLFLLKTTAPTDATVTTANSQVVTPALITGTNYVGFRGSFTGFARYMLIDGPLCNTPAATVTPAGPTAFCQGSSVLLNANTGAGLTYQWQKDAANIPGATNASYTAATEGNYAVIVNQSVCDSTSLPVFINVDSTTLAAITGTASLCTGQTTTLANASTGGTWASGDPAVATINSAGVVSGLSSGTAAISYTVVNFCGIVTTTVAVTVSAPVAVAPVTGTLSVCVGALTTLGNTTPLGAWSTSAAGVATVNASGVVSGIATGTATISYGVTNTAGCTSSSTAIITVNALPVATIIPAGPTTFCTGGFVVLNATTGTGLTYVWRRGALAITGATTAAYTANTTGNYSVIITNASGCTATSSAVAVTVNTSVIIVPSVSIVTTPGTTLCSPTTLATFTAIPVNGGATPAYQWTVNGVPVAVGATYSYIPAAGDIVAVTMTSSDICAFPQTAAASVTMSISGALTPSVTINPYPNDSICIGDTVTLGAVPVNGGTAPTYLWTENGVNVATGPYYIYAPANGDLLIVTMNSNYPCLSTPVAVSPVLVMHTLAPSANTVALTVSPAAVAPGQTATFTATATNAGTAPVYKWFINGILVPGATGPVYTTDSLINGQIINCSVTSSVICANPHTIVSGGVIAHVVTSGIEGVAGSSSIFTLLPNPNKGTFTIKGTLASLNDDQLTITVSDMLGQVVYTKLATTTSTTVYERITLPAALATGMYLVNITSGTTHQVFHMVVDK